MKHTCNQEEQLKKISSEIFGCDENDKEGLKDKVKALHAELKLRPTFTSIIITAVGAIGAGVTLLIFLFNFLLTNQSAMINSKIETAISTHTQQESTMWASRQKQIEDDVWVRIAKYLGKNK